MKWSCSFRVEQEVGCAKGKDAPFVYWTRRAVGACKTRLPKLKDFFFRDRRHEVPRHLSGGLYIQKPYVGQLEAVCLAMDALLSLL